MIQIKNLTLNSTDPYAKGYIIPMAEDKMLLKRDKFKYNPTGTNDRTYLVKENDNIWDIAFRELGSSRDWFKIMDVNPTILNPFTIDVGTELIIPDLDQLKVQ